MAVIDFSLPHRPGLPRARPSPVRPHGKGLVDHLTVDPLPRELSSQRRAGSGAAGGLARSTHRPGAKASSSISPTLGEPVEQSVTATSAGTFLRLQRGGQLGPRPVLRRQLPHEDRPCHLLGIGLPLTLILDLRSRVTVRFGPADTADRCPRPRSTSEVCRGTGARPPSAWNTVRPVNSSRPPDTVGESSPGDQRPVSVEPTGRIEPVSVGPRGRIGTRRRRARGHRAPGPPEALGPKGQGHRRRPERSGRRLPRLRRPDPPPARPGPGRAAFDVARTLRAHHSELHLTGHRIDPGRGVELRDRYRAAP